MAVPSVDIIARGRGRPTTDDLEARTPLGRAVHLNEGRNFGISLECIRRRETRPLWAQGDDGTDTAIRGMGTVRERMAAHPDPVVRAWAVELAGYEADYWRHDATEDAVTLGHFDAFEVIHGFSRAVGGFLERLAVAIRGRS